MLRCKVHFTYINVNILLLKTNRAKKLFVIEKDKKLSSDLENKFYNQITIINEDVLKVDEKKLFKEHFQF